MVDRQDPLEVLAAATSSLRPTADLSDAVLARLGAEDVDGTLARHAAATETLSPSSELTARVMARVAAEAGAGATSGRSSEGARLRVGATLVAAALAAAAVGLMVRERSAFEVDVATADWVEIE